MGGTRDVAQGAKGAAFGVQAETASQRDGGGAGREGGDGRGEGHGDGCCLGGV